MVRDIWHVEWGTLRKSYYSSKFGDYGSCGSAYLKFFILVWACGQKVMLLNRWDAPTVSYQSVKFIGHRYCGSADKGFHLSSDHVVKISHDLEIWVPPP